MSVSLRLIFGDMVFWFGSQIWPVGHLCKKPAPYGAGFAVYSGSGVFQIGWAKAVGQQLLQGKAALRTPAVQGDDLQVRRKF